MFFIILFFLLSSSMSEATQSSLCEDVFLEKNAKDIISLMPYEEAKAFIRDLDFKNRIEFFKFVQSTELPDGFPKSPHIVYREGWEGWPEFLGVEAEILNNSSQEKILSEDLKGNFYNGNSLGEDLGLDFTEETHNEDSLEEKKQELITKVLEEVSREEKKPSEETKKKSQTKTRSRSAVKSSTSSHSVSRRNQESQTRDWLSYERAAQAFVQKHKREFSGKKNKAQTRKWLSYEEAKAYIQKKNFKNKREFLKWSASPARPSNFPANPNFIYTEEWENWGEFLGTGNKSTRKKEWMPYKEAKALIQKQNIFNIAQFREWSKSGKRPYDFPSSPNKVYEEWENWPEFLGTDNKPNPKRDWMPYEEAKKITREQAIFKARQFQQWSQSGERPLNLPSNPEKVYEEWEGWPVFLGTEDRPGLIRDWRPYEKAKAFIQEEGILSVAQFREWSKSGKRPSNFPSRPDRVYQEEWKGWPTFLGTEDRPRRRNWLPYEEAKALVQKKSFKSREEFIKWSKSGKRPPNIPTNPSIVYQEDWPGWGEFLGTGHKSQKEWMTYEEAKAFIQKKTFKSKKEFVEWRKTSARPPDFPTDPSRVYQEKWENWKEFLGIQGQPQTKEWMSYEEAKAFIQEEGILSAAQFREWSKSPARPPDFPSTPNKIYQAQWEGWGQFLGTGNQRQKEWMSYEEAKAFIQEQAIFTVAQFHEWSRSPSRLANIPTNPNIVYKAQWENWPVFLGTAN